jgi:OOP family OmpA-OmpF porin
MKSHARIIAAAFAAALAGPALAADYHDRVYIDALYSYVATGSTRASTNDSGYQVGFGMPVLENINLELNLQQREYPFDFGGPFDHRIISLDAQFLSDPTAPTTPFFLLGLGQEDVETNFGSDSDTHATVGVGLMSAITDNIALRADLRYQFGGVPDDVGDLVGSIGVRVYFGAVDAAPAPAAAPPVDGDSDRDGVRDSMDRCPGTPYGTSVDASGCALPVDGDADGDGVKDSMDRCPGTLAGAAVNASGCEPDGDGDGVVDRLDQCPSTPAGVRVEPNGCNPDDDGDGVKNVQDRCPGTPAGTRVDSNGCTLTKVINLEGVTFGTNSAEITAGSKAKLDEAVATLAQNPDIKVEVAGHTDNLGRAEGNRALSQRRADSVMAYLVAGGIDAARLTARGYGPDEPVASNDTDAGRAQNRRVELKVKD